jgi:hypothetical protein
MIDNRRDVDAQTRCRLTVAAVADDEVEGLLSAGKRRLGLDGDVSLSGAGGGERGQGKDLSKRGHGIDDPEKGAGALKTPARRGFADQ